MECSRTRTGSLGMPSCKNYIAGAVFEEIVLTALLRPILSPRLDLDPHAGMHGNVYQSMSRRLNAQRVQCCYNLNQPQSAQPSASKLPTRYILDTSGTPTSCLPTQFFSHECIYLAPFREAPDIFNSYNINSLVFL